MKPRIWGYLKLYEVAIFGLKVEFEVKRTAISSGNTAVGGIISKLFPVYLTYVVSPVK